MDLLYSIRIWAVNCFIVSQSKCLTDGQTEVDSKTVRMHLQPHDNYCNNINNIISSILWAFSD